MSLSKPCRPTRWTVLALPVYFCLKSSQYSKLYIVYTIFIITWGAVTGHVMVLVGSLHHWDFFKLMTY